jgi:D-3-phosphoglycerate dehydrogenase / 2-oxoglutarate reductase
VTPPVVVVAAGMFEPAVIAAENERGRARLALHRLDRPDSLRAATTDAAAVMISTHPLPAASIAALAPSVRIIGRAGIGLDAIDLEAARARGVAVFHTPDYCTTEVAEHAAAMILALGRRLFAADAVARRDWPAWRSLGAIRALADSTLGVVGCGRIGREVIARMAPFGLRILAFDPWIEQAPPPAELVTSLDELLAGSDIVTLHSPLTDETRGLIGAAELARMRPGAYLVNVSRGALLDEAAVAAALASGQLGGAAIDVLATEPPPPGSPILGAPNTIITPHTAWYSVASEQRVFAETIEGVTAYLRGEEPAAGRLAVRP